MSIALLGLLSLGLLLPLFMGSDSSDSDEDSSETEPLDLTEIDGDSILGTEGDDTLNIDARDGGFEGITLETGAGDDLLNLSVTGPDDTPRDATWWWSQIDMGEGDDTIDASVELSHVQGGDGDDIMSFDHAGVSTIEGGAGNDLIEAPYIDETEIYGGEGDDTIRVEDAGGSIGTIRGGPGDDLIETGGPGDVGAGYFASTYGDEGDDTISYTSGDVSFFLASPNSIYGGEGADLFQVHFNEGLYSEETDPGLPRDAVQPDGTYRFGVVGIEDFETGVDHIEIHADIAGDGYEITSARIENGTQLIVRYEHATEPTRDLVIGAGAGLVWDDVTFVGDHIPPVLQPVA
ncbi:hypothetical protein J7443_12085 [Tropicibacter sp. R15_0]|uniref:hypothetical protein n=1 Tax=Tropicibacter sp. R15_0 TaxID=2821101 RepID=UPI001ADA16B6|nr:hypothetical protein [Tropicibacter sp. R15_0]MBO9465974.1 hypothetical protein [Tropicibacter sp. R15_0]